MIEGVDLSGNQGKIDAAKIIAVKAFVYLQCTEGVNFVDPSFGLFLGQFRALGFDDIGAYHYLRVRHGVAQDADVQAQQHFEQLDKNRIKLISWFDAETRRNEAATQQECADAIGMYTERFMQLAGRMALYTSRGEWEQNGDKSMGTLVPAATVVDKPLALAAYTPGDDMTLPDPWRTAGVGWAFHQYAGDVGNIGKCQGVTTNCDLDRFNGTIEQLRSL
jgi:GH25 family lysozyme M1 (1,4-beta-N-acetylmuramidase)